MHDRLFPRPENDLLYLLMLPLIVPVMFIFFLVLPILFFYLDRLDTVKDHTLGWSVIAEKIAAEKLPPDEHHSTAAG